MTPHRPIIHLLGWTLPILLAVLLLNACGGSNTDSANQLDEEQAAAFADLPFPSAASLTASHAIQAEGPYTFTSEDVLYSSNTSYTGAVFQLIPLPTSTIMFGINTNTALPSSVTVSGTLDQLFIGLADYASERWEWLGPFDSEQTISLLTGEYQSPAGGCYIALAAASGGSAAVSVTVDIAPEDYDDSWNVLCWLAADNYLAPTAYSVMQDLETTGSTSDITLLAGYDIDPDYLDSAQLGADMVRFIKVVADSDDSSIATDGDSANREYARAGFDSGDPVQLAAFVDWAATNFPASHTALVLFGLGDGWRSSGTDDERETSGVLADYTDGSVVITANQDIVNALADYQFDLVVFDASCSGQLEALYEYRELADWTVASQITVPAGDYPFADWITGWQEAFPIPPGAVGWRFVEAANDSYGSLDLPYFTNNLNNMAQIDELTDALAQLMEDSESWPIIIKPQISDAISLTMSGGRTSYGTIDLRLFLENLESSASVFNVRTHCEEALLALDRFSTHDRQSTTLAVSGLSIYMPTAGWFTDELQAEYALLDFDQDLGWLDWLSELDLPSSVTVRDWERGWRLVVEYADASVDAELEVFDPDDNYGRPGYTTEVDGILEFSADNLTSGSADEWAELLDGGGTGAYAFDVYHRGDEPETLTLTAWLEDSDGAQVQDFGSFSVDAGDRVNVAALRLVDYGESSGTFMPGDVLELSWSDSSLDVELRIRNPELTYGGVSFPAAYAGTMVFGPRASVSGELAEWGRLSTTAPVGDYQVLAYVHDISTGLPASGTAQVQLKLYDSTGALKLDLGTHTLSASDASDGTVIFKQLAVLAYAL